MSALSDKLAMLEAKLKRIKSGEFKPFNVESADEITARVEAGIREVKTAIAAENPAPKETKQPA
jgi:hypothetical protein